MMSEDGLNATHRGGEVRVPPKLMAVCLADKKIRELRLFAAAKLDGHRCNIKDLQERLGLHPKTITRLIKKLVNYGWAGTDGKFIFPRSWKKIGFNKHGGLYITETPFDLKEFQALCFAKALKKFYRYKRSPHSSKGRVTQQDFTDRYISRAFGMKERRFKTIKAQAKRRKFISVEPQFDIVGKGHELENLRKHLLGMPIFRKGRYCVVPKVAKIRVLI